MHVINHRPPVGTAFSLSAEVDRVRVIQLTIVPGPSIYPKAIHGAVSRQAEFPQNSVPVMYMARRRNAIATNGPRHNVCK